jgi:hypothetical protein
MEESRTDEARTQYIFVLMRDEDDESVGIATKEFWEENGHLNDVSFDSDPDLAAVLPRGFEEAAESIFHYHGGDLDDARRVLLAAGFEQVDNPWEPKDE